MKKFSKLFVSPKRAIATIACAAALLVAAGTGTALAASTIAESSSIGKENAKNFAFVDAGIDPVEAKEVEAEFGFEQGQFVYEVTFRAGEIEYEYWIHSGNGSVVKKKMEYLSDGQDVVVTAKLTLDAAKRIALADAALETTQVTFTKAELESEDGAGVYELEFFTDATAYDYKIDALRGSILSREQEPLPNAPQPAPSTAPAEPATQPSETAGPLSLAEAKRRALADAGLTETEVTFRKAELEKDNGRSVYELEFQSTANRYEYTLDARTGALLSREMERMDPSVPTSGSPVTIEQAKEIAFHHAGCTAESATLSKATVDRDDGRTVYEIEFYFGNLEYEYEIDADSGTILAHEAEPAN